MRDGVLRELARRAGEDPEFLARLRGDVRGTLARYAYDLTGEELRLVEDLGRRTAALGDGELARMLAAGLGGRTGTPPARPAAPGRRGPGPARPGDRRSSPPT